MSVHEFAVDYNLSESGAWPVTLRELIGEAPEVLEDLMETRLDYSIANGIADLREKIAGIYPGASAENVLVTVGSVEANYTAVHSVLGPGDKAVSMIPNYLQAWGSMVNLGAEITTFPCIEEQGWAPDLDAMKAAVTPGTKLIAVCNPNNPTGRVMTEAEMDAIVATADRVGAWILADEVYRGAERVTADDSPSFFGRYDKVLCTASLSKAYGLAGLRLGWVLGEPKMLEEIWARTEYTTISQSILAMKLAAYALRPEVRPRLIERARGFIRRGYPILEEWVNGRDDLRLYPPDAAAVAFMKYTHDIPSFELTEKIRTEANVLVVPGAHFGVEQCIRISYGLPPEFLKEGLARVGDVMDTLMPVGVPA